MSGTTMPTNDDVRERSAAAIRLGSYPRRFAAALTRRRVRGLTAGCSRSAREAVDADTCAAAATSASVAWAGSAISMATLSWRPAHVPTPRNHRRPPTAAEEVPQGPEFDGIGACTDPRSGACTRPTAEVCFGAVTTPISDQLDGAPDNWGRWGADDEVGALNFLGPAQVLRGVAAVRSGRTFALGIPIAAPGGDPVWPGRTAARRFAVQDKSTYDAGHEGSNGGEEFADDMLLTYLHGTTHTDALGHMWYDDTLYNGYPAAATVGWLERASVLPLAQRGVVGRAVLLDIARLRGK